MKLIKDTSINKLRGGFYTPESIVSFILKWSFNGNKKCDVLEPSSGNGHFLKKIKEEGYDFKSLHAIEIDKLEATKSKAINLRNSKIINSDFHKFCNKTKLKFDLIVGNPPYIRYQFFDKQQQTEASNIFEKAGLKYSKLTNAWVSFVVGSSLLLKEEGKIAFVLPAEILQVSFAKPLRVFLSHFYNKILKRFYKAHPEMENENVQKK
jgi:adenine-specific DNA methylase